MVYINDIQVRFQEHAPFNLPLNRLAFFTADRNILTILELDACIYPKTSAMQRSLNLKITERFQISTCLSGYDDLKKNLSPFAHLLWLVCAGGQFSFAFFPGRCPVFLWDYVQADDGRFGLEPGIDIIGVFSKYGFVCIDAQCCRQNL